MGIFRKSAIITTAWVASLGLASGAVADTGTTATASSGALTNTGTFYDSTPPPEFQASQSMQMANLFSSCMNIGSTISQLGQLFVKKGVSCTTNLTCQGPDSAPGVDGLTCDQFISGGRFDSSLLNNYKTRVDQAFCTIECKKNKFSDLQTQLSCLGTQADLLSQQAASLQASYTSNIQRFENDVSKLRSIEADRDFQLKDVNSKLDGSGAPGDPGLLNLRDTTQQKLGDWNAKITGPGGIQEQQKQSVNQHKAFDQQVQYQTIANTEQCFSQRPSQGFRCTPNGPPVSARDYVLCRYQQNQQIGQGGEILQDTNSVNKASAGASSLGALIDQILGDSPGAKPTFNPSDPNGSGAAMQSYLDSGSSILTVADIENQYGDQLAAYNGKGLNIHDFVIKYMSSCFTRATRTVQNQLLEPGTTLGSQKQQLDANDRMIASNVHQLLADMNAQYTQDMAGLTGQHISLDTSACDNAAPQNQLNCLNDVKTNLEGMLYGNVAQSTMNVTIKAANDPSLNVAFQCQGLMGCVTMFQNLSRNLTLEKQKVSEFKRNYIQQANQSVIAFTKQMAQALSPQSQALMNRLKQMNATMAALGVNGGIDIKTVEPENFEYDKEKYGDQEADGLVKIPKNALNLVGSQMNPPMLDVSSNNFSSALQGVSTSVNDLNSKEGDIQSSMDRLAQLPNKCTADLASKKFEKLQNDVDNFSNANCWAVDNWCSNGGKSSVESLTDSVNGLGDVNGLDQTDISNIDSSLQDGASLCSQNQKTMGQSGDQSASGQQQPRSFVTSVSTKPAYCNGISTRIKRDIANVKAAGNTGTSRGADE